MTFLIFSQELSTSDELRIDNVDYSTKFCILKTKRLHSGIYKINAKNSSGEDNAELEVTVLG